MARVAKLRALPAKKPVPATVSAVPPDGELTLTPYQFYILMSVIDSGAVRPIPEIRRLRRLVYSFKEATGDYIQKIEDIGFAHQHQRDQIPLDHPNRQRLLLEISKAENEAVESLQPSGSKATVTLPLSGVDYLALQKWWKETPGITSAKSFREDVLAVDDALGGGEDGS